jgi:hypothetical protein
MLQEMALHPPSRFQIADVQGKTQQPRTAQQARPRTTRAQRASPLSQRKRRLHLCLVPWRWGRAGTRSGQQSTAGGAREADEAELPAPAGRTAAGATPQPTASSQQPAASRQQHTACLVVPGTGAGAACRGMARLTSERLGSALRKPANPLRRRRPKLLALLRACPSPWDGLGRVEFLCASPAGCSVSARHSMSQLFARGRGRACRLPRRLALCLPPATRCSSTSSPAPSIAALLKQSSCSSSPPRSPDEALTLNGFVRSVRKQKRVAFAAIGDGSSLKTVQAVLTPEQADGSVSRPRHRTPCSSY